MPSMIRYDEAALIRLLESIPPQRRAIFALCVAERMWPAYAAYCRICGKDSDQALMSTILQDSWEDVQDAVPPDSQKLLSRIGLAMSLIPSERDSKPWIPQQAWAEDAGAAIVYALRCLLTGQSQEGAWAARSAYTALDHFVRSQQDKNASQAGAEEQVLSHPLIQAELLRQRRDLDQLASMEFENVLQAVVLQLRLRAKIASTEFLGPATQ